MNHILYEIAFQSVSELVQFVGGSFVRMKLNRVV